MSIRFEIVRNNKGDRRIYAGAQENVRNRWLRTSYFGTNSGSGQWYATVSNANRAIRQLCKKHPAYNRYKFYVRAIAGND